MKGDMPPEWQLWAITVVGLLTIMAAMFFLGAGTLGNWK